MYVKNSPASKFKLKQPDSNSCIYALIDPRDNKIKYIGLTTTGFSRIATHYNAKKKENTRKVNWVNKLKSLNLCFTVEYLQYCNSVEELKTAEKYWIKYYKSIGVDLLNHTEGGEDIFIPIYTDEQRKLHSEKVKKGMKAPGVIEKIRQANIGNTIRRGKKYTKEQLEYITKRNKEVSGIKIVDQYGNLYLSARELSKQIKCSVNTIKDRLNVNPDKPLKGLLLKRLEQDHGKY